MRDPLFHITAAALECLEKSHSLTDLWSNLVDVDELLTSKAFEALDLHDLPTYGGEPIAPQPGVWSWDATRVLVSAWLAGDDDIAGFALVTREQFSLLTGDRRDRSTADGDTGTIVRVEGAMAVVSWDQGVRLPAPITELEKI